MDHGKGDWRSNKRSYEEVSREEERRDEGRGGSCRSGGNRASAEVDKAKGRGKVTAPGVRRRHGGRSSRRGRTAETRRRRLRLGQGRSSHNNARLGILGGGGRARAGWRRGRSRQEARRLGRQPIPRSPRRYSQRNIDGECFKCGRTGHFQAACTFEPPCILCKTEGHVSANFPSRGNTLRLHTRGHAFAGYGFYYLEMDPVLVEERATPVIFPAVISFKENPLSVSELEVELKSTS
jgi:hypothetical protein